LQFTKGEKLIMATDSNSRSTMWNDKKINPRGKMLEEFVASNHLHVINEDNKRTTFQSNRRKSNIDLTITNNQMLANIKKWDISEEESASDHNLMKFKVRLDKNNYTRKQLFQNMIQNKGTTTN
jgi:hypothetical protein